MFKCVEYNESLKDEWEQFAQARGTVFHTLAIRQILTESFGYECRYQAIVDEESRIRAIVPLAIGRNLGLKKAGVSLPFVNYTDICADSDEAFRFALESLEAVKDRYRISYVELRLKDQSVDRPGWQTDLHNHTFVLPLKGGEEAVLALSTGNNRNHVRKVYKNDWFDVSFDKGNLEAFHRVYVRRMKQLGSPAADVRFFERFFTYLPEQASLLTVIDKMTGDVVGGMQLLASPGNATLYYMNGANLIEYNNKYLNNFMYWEAVKHGIARGLDYLDLGRSQTGSGTYIYKMKFGALPVQLKYSVYGGGAGGGGAPDRESFGFAVRMWQAAPSFITDFAGKRLIKYVMP